MKINCLDIIFRFLLSFIYKILCGNNYKESRNVSNILLSATKLVRRDNVSNLLPTKYTHRVLL